MKHGCAGCRSRVHIGAIVEKEADQIEKIWDIVDAAQKAFDEHKATEYKIHIKKLRQVVVMYGDLTALGASTKYEYGDYGIKELNKLMIMMSKTSVGY